MAKLFLPFENALRNVRGGIVKLWPSAAERRTGFIAPMRS
jgi:hypothetical protein